MTITDVKKALRGNGFWGAAGPMAARVLISLGLLGIVFLINLARRYEVHLEKPHAGVIEHLDEVDATLLKHDLFHVEGKRFTAERGARLAEIMEEAMTAYLEGNDTAMRASLSDIQAFRRGGAP